MRSRCHQRQTVTGAVRQHAERTYVTSHKKDLSSGAVHDTCMVQSCNAPLAATPLQRTPPQRTQPQPRRTTESRLDRAHGAPCTRPAYLSVGHSSVPALGLHLKRKSEVDFKI
jgi:hypothetical protein